MTPSVYKKEIIIIDIVIGHRVSTQNTGDGTEHKIYIIRNCIQLLVQ